MNIMKKSSRPIPKANAQKKSSKDNLKNISKSDSSASSGKSRTYLRGAATAVMLVLWVWASVMVSQFATAYIMIGIVGKEEVLQPVSYAIYSALSYVLALVLIVLVPILATKIHKKSTIEKPTVGSDQQATQTLRKKFVAERNRLGLRGLPTWTDIGLAPVGFVIYLVLAVAFTSVFSVFPWFNLDEAQNIGFSLTISGSDRVVAFLTLVVIAPIAEEIIFRGWLYGKLRDGAFKKLSTGWRIGWSVFLTSLLFGILHQQWNVGVNVFAMSIVLCGLREFTGAIHAGILLHMLKNGLAFYSLFVAGIG